ncbi:hypothetical protein D1871_11295 [Nakamurella silvestris]|nr:hypothetical protein D1871_11295 [Nakamurella silvestris]
MSNDSRTEIHVVLEYPGDHRPPFFVEIEDQDGHSIDVTDGAYTDPNGLYHLIIVPGDFGPAAAQTDPTACEHHYNWTHQDNFPPGTYWVGVCEFCQHLEFDADPVTPAESIARAETAALTAVAAVSPVCGFNVGDNTPCRCLLPRGHSGLHSCEHDRILGEGGADNG